MNNAAAPSAQQNTTPQQPYQGLVKPEQIFNLPFLSDEAKQRYNKGIAEFWAKIRTHPQTSPTHLEAYRRLREVSQKLSNDLKAYKAQQEANGRDQNIQRGVQRPQGQDQIPQQPQGNNQADVLSSTSQTPTIQSQGQQEFAPYILQRVANMPWFKPKSIPDGPEAEAWIASAKIRYASALRDGEKALGQIKNLTAMMDQYKQQGKEPSEQMKMQKANAEREVAKSRDFIESLTNQLREGRAAAELSASATGVGNAGSSGLAAQLQSGQQPRPVVQGSSLPQSNQQGRPLPSTSAIGQPGSQLPNSHVGQQQFPPRPQPNPTQATHSGNQQTNSPQTVLPQSGATHPQAYTHEAAVAAASRSYTNPPQGGTPQSATTSNGQTSNRIDTERINTPNSSNFRIAKNLNLPPPSPVTMGPARPTMSGTSSGPMGMMGQPAIQKQPSFLLQGPGDRVLDKKKLDELVRQVTGGVDGPGGETLTPEVEESILQLADEFVDNVVTSACKLAKLRGSPQLEIRDLQLIIERQYNIRIPGFASDEIRTVRKVQPNASYLHKMNAVQAAKVMGGNKEI